MGIHDCTIPLSIFSRTTSVNSGRQSNPSGLPRAGPCWSVMGLENVSRTHWYKVNRIVRLIKGVRWRRKKMWTDRCSTKTFAKEV